MMTQELTLVKPTPAPECHCGELHLCGPCIDAIRDLRATEPAPFEPSDEDARYNAEHSPANKEGYSVAGESGPFDLELRTVSALQYFNECLDSSPEPTALSGDWR